MGSILLLLFLLSFTFSDFISEAYDPLDPYGNITIKWDIQSWTTSGYAAIVTLFNYQQYRHIQEPGWELGWTWAKKEVIWNVMGGQTTEQGDCSNFKGEFIPHCCLKNPTIVDLLPGAPYNLRTTNCCKGGVLSSLLQDPANYVSSFQLFIGAAGTTNKTVRLPKHFTLNAPGPGYTCGPAKKVEPTRYASPDGRRVTQAMMTWTVTCTYSQFLAQRTPTCCVSLSAFYNKNIVPCLRCACGCQDNRTNLGSYVDPNLPYSASIVPETTETNYAPLVRCTSHMCPVRIHWHVMRNYQEYWRVKVTVTNFNYRMNYTQWNMVIQHPNFENLTQTFSLDYKPLNHYESINDTALLYGVKFYNDLLMQAGPSGFVQSELLFRKDKPSFTFEGGWAFPRRVYFNGDDCVMPPPNVYPYLPNSSLGLQISLVTLLTTLFLALAFFHSFI